MTRTGEKISRRAILARIGRVAAASSSDFCELVKISGLQPDKDFVDADLTGIDFSGVDLRGFNLKGCLVSRGALSHRDLTDLGAIECDIPFEARAESEGQFAPIERKRKQIVEAVERKLQSKMERRSKAVYWNPRRRRGVVITISRNYGASGKNYWFAFHPSWLKFLEASSGLFVLGGTDLGIAYAVPIATIIGLLRKLSRSVRPSGEKYWHVHLVPGSRGYHAIKMVANRTPFDLGRYRLDLSQDAD